MKDTVMLTAAESAALEAQLRQLGRLAAILAAAAAGRGHAEAKRAEAGGEQAEECVAGARAIEAALAAGVDRAAHRANGWAEVLRARLMGVPSVPVAPGVAESVVSLEGIRAAVCQVYRVTWEELVGKGRSPAVVAARAAACHVAHAWAGKSWPEIAAWMGRDSHSSAMTSAARAANPEVSSQLGLVVELARSPAPAGIAPAPAPAPGTQGPGPGTDVAGEPPQSPSPAECVALVAAVSGSAMGGGE